MFFLFIEELGDILLASHLKVLPLFIQLTDCVQQRVGEGLLIFVLNL